ncbi:MAG TPA: C4-dicarboxylate TRAP transporter substrate-binding protein [Limnochordales bacterium]
MARKLIGSVVLAALVVGLIGSMALAKQPTYVLRFNHVLGPNHPYHAGLQKWAERVYERTNGDLQILVFHSSQLGVEEDIIEQIRQGVPVGQNTDAARMGNYVKDIAVMNGPYFVESIEDVVKLNDLPIVKQWIDRLANEFGIRVLSFNWVQGYRHFMTNKPIRRPEDLRGQRIRTPPAPIWQESVRALGAVPVAVNFGDIYPALQQRAIDGAELVYDNIIDGSLYEVLRYVNETKHFLLINFEVVSEKWFRSLPAEYQQILVEEADRAGLETSRFIEANTARVREEVQRRGMTIITDIDYDAFRKAGEAAYERLGLAEVRRELYQQLGK